MLWGQGPHVTWIKKNMETLIDASKEVGLERSIEKTKHMLLSHHWNAGQNRHIKIANRSFGNVPQFKYLGMTKNSKSDSGGC
jgi:hypothetical protein